jgi:hypothetical protein
MMMSFLQFMHENHYQNGLHLTLGWIEHAWNGSTALTDLLYELYNKHTLNFFNHRTRVIRYSQTHMKSVHIIHNILTFKLNQALIFEMCIILMYPLRTSCCECLRRIETTLKRSSSLVKLCS